LKIFPYFCGQTSNQYFYKMEQHHKFLKPAQFAEKEIIKSILEGKFQAGQTLMPERELASLLGITRPTLREALQRLSRDGWITIKHGRPTLVNDFQNDGGLGVLKSLTDFGELASQKLVNDWLEFRILIFPHLAQKAIDSNSNEILMFLNELPKENAENQEFALFDWNLQLLLIKYSGNSIAKMLYNDLTIIYLKQAEVYFSSEDSKQMSINFYSNIKNCIKTNTSSAFEIVKNAMLESAKKWKVSL